jgi:hypothetical protein
MLGFRQNGGKRRICSKSVGTTSPHPGGNFGSANMRETWLDNNRRITGLALGVSILFFALSLVSTWFSFQRVGMAMRLTAACVLLVSGGIVVRQAVSFFTPRLTYADRYLSVNLGGRPIRVPIDVVEVFFLGQAPSQLRQQGRDIANSTVVVRLAESAVGWHEKKVDKRLGQWSDGYITIRGIWCEKLNVDVIRRLNHRLVEVKRELCRPHD